MSTGRVLSIVQVSLGVAVVVAAGGSALVIVLGSVISGIGVARELCDAYRDVRAKRQWEEESANMQWRLVPGPGA